MANGTTETGIMQKGEYKHPDFPERSLERLMADGAKFDFDAHAVSLLFNEPFYADIIRSLHKTESNSMPTLGVLHKDNTMLMFWNRLFLAAYDNKTVGGIFKHEALHLALEHTTTRRYQPHTVWNWATDLAINSTLTMDEFPPCGLKPGVKFKTPHDFKNWVPDQQTLHLKLSALVESLPPNLMAEEYFGRLMDDPAIKEMLEKQKGKGKGKGEPGEGEPGPGEPGYGGMDDHDGWDELSDEEREYVAGKVRQAVKEAQEKADSKNSWGSVPIGMRAEIRRKVQGEIDWKAVLRHFIGTTNRADRIGSIYRANKKYPGIHPGTNRDHRPSIGIYLDQSGSVSDMALELFFGELCSLSSRADFYLYNFDTSVDEASEKKWTKSTGVKLERTRCGGTDFNATVEHMKKSKRKFEGVIILTDGGAPKPDSARGYRRCWVLEPGTDLAFNNPDAKDIVVKLKKSITRN